jgi:hypothetical protein
MKQQFVFTHTARPTEIPALLNSWIKNTPSVKIMYAQKVAAPSVFVRTSRASLKVTTSCCFMSETLDSQPHFRF